jgi:dihydroflavonol-4-reductase
MKTTLITGATGFVGSAVLRHLVKAGHKVRALIRPNSDRRNLEGQPVEICVGDLTDRSSLERALAGCTFLFHVAADYRLWAPQPRAIYECNVNGTRNIMSAAARAGVSRIVYTSSVATLGLTGDGTPADEETPVVFGDMVGDYKRSKFLAEAEVGRMVKEERLPVIIVNPSTPVGPRDIKPTPTGRMIVDALAGRIPAYVDTGLNLVHVDDVAAGHMLALERGKIGERYILGAVNMTLKQILWELASLTGRRAPRLRLPHNLVLPLAYLSEGWAWITRGKEPRITRVGVRLAKKRMFFSTQKARRVLGFQPRPVEEGLREAVEWFRKNGYLK